MLLTKSMLLLFAREWIALAGFRATRVEADFGYVEYKVVAQHRERWVRIVALSDLILSRDVPAALTLGPL